jgi:mannose-6-phosphate isomerase-like protein (cupin superfamily)
MKDLDLGPGTMTWQGVQYRTILSSAATGGAMSIVDTISPPLSGPPRHVHEQEDETFVMTSGAVEIWMEGELSRLEAGQCAFIPRGTEHTFRVVSHEPARKLVILTPGGFEGFFEEMARGSYRIPEDMEEIGRISAQFHNRFTGPPLG